MFLFSSIGWRLGLQAVTGVVFLTFFLGTFYRSASLYHPQRRAILHLKSQKRKIKNKDKEKNKAQDDRPPYFDFTTLRSRTIQILLLSIFVSSFGMNAPLFYLVRECNIKDLLKIHISITLFPNLLCRPSRPFPEESGGHLSSSCRPSWAWPGPWAAASSAPLSPSIPKSARYPGSTSARSPSSSPGSL